MEDRLKFICESLVYNPCLVKWSHIYQQIAESKKTKGKNIVFIVPALFFLILDILTVLQTAYFH